MKFNNSYIIILTILGVILLYSYYYLAITNKNTVLKLWGRIKGNFLYLYYLSMLLSAIGFLLLYYYLLISNNLTKDQINKLFISLVLIVVISMFWMPLSLYYLKNPKIIYKYLILLILLLVALSILYLLFVLSAIKDDKNKIQKQAAIIGMSYFFIHAFFFDFTMWSYNFF